MKYTIFDTLGEKKSQNKIIAVLKEEAQTFDELSEKTNLDRTSVFYHIKNMEKEGKIIKRFIGKVAYVGLTKDNRLENKENGNITH